MFNKKKKRLEQVVRSNARNTSTYTGFKGIYTAAGGTVPLTKAQYDKIKKRSKKPSK